MHPPSLLDVEPSPAPAPAARPAPPPAVRAPAPAPAPAAAAALSAAPEAYTPFPCQVAASADLWFAERSADVERAKALCGPCPVRRACLAGALERGEPWGVWGGEVFVDGVVVPSKRGRGRPRKAPLQAA